MPLRKPNEQYHQHLPASFFRRSGKCGDRQAALKYAYRLDLSAVEGDTLNNQKKADIDQAAKACAAAPGPITRKALVAAVERYIAR